MPRVDRVRVRDKGQPSTPPLPLPPPQFRSFQLVLARYLGKLCLAVGVRHLRVPTKECHALGRPQQNFRTLLIRNVGLTWSGTTFKQH